MFIKVNRRKKNWNNEKVQEKTSTLRVLFKNKKKMKLLHSQKVSC